MNTPGVRFQNTAASTFLDLVRVVAAFLVVIDHGRNFVFIDFRQLPGHTLWTTIFYLLTKAGHQAVVIFFVLSGYLISGSILRLARQGSFAWPSYLTHRLVRLWIVLLPGLLLCAFWDKLALSLHLAPRLYQSETANHLGNLTLGTFLTNMFFLQDAFGPVFGSNSALWSLSAEFWYYILFPLGFFTLARRSRMSTRLACGTLFVLVASVGHVFLHLFPIWLAGSLLAVLPVPKFSRTFRVLGTIGYVPFFFFCAAYRGEASRTDYALTLATVLFLWLLLSARKEVHPASLSVRATRLFAGLSYTLYIVHGPFLLLLTALVLGEDRWTLSPSHLLKAVGMTALVFGYAYAVASMTEFHTEKVRRWIEQSLSSARLFPSQRSLAQTGPSFNR